MTPIIIIYLVIINIIAFMLALALTRGLRGTNIFRTVFFLPNLIGGIVLGYIWQILLDCKDAPLDDSVDSFDRSSRNYLSFTATSDELGVYKRVVYISEDGYFATNIFDYSHIYFIGADAAGKIIEYAKQNSVEGAAEAYEQTVSGTLVEIGEDYVLVDDSVLCRKKEDGTVYKIYTNDIRMKRCVEVAGSKVGDIVVVKYDGEISDSNEITEAYSMDKGRLIDGSVAVPE